MLLDLPCTLFSMTTAGQPLFASIAQHLRFNPAMEALADQVVAGIMHAAADIPVSTGSRDAGSFEGFNGLHLRIEKDAADWTNILGGVEAFWNLYKAQMVAAGFEGSRLPLYVASGLLSYNTSSSQLEDLQKRYVHNHAPPVLKWCELLKEKIRNGNEAKVQT